MDSGSIAFLVLALLVMWGGLFLATVYLTLRPEPTAWPPGAEDDLTEDELDWHPDE
ncbi:MAG: hypothetical protein LBR33_10170 [Propionibacteriaceae bacterium]|jgi:hypothetical protein|nr:hypothetical protein [Propionibacteriaceae bacterium]